MDGRRARRPASVTFIAWLNVASGASTVAGAAIAAVLWSMTGGLSAAGLDALPVRLDPSLLHWETAGAVVVFVLGLWRLVAGVGLLRDRPWGRHCTLFYAFAALLFVVVSDAVVLSLLPSLLAQLQAQVAPAAAMSELGLDLPTELLAGLGSAVRLAALGETISALLFNGWVIFVLTTPKVIAILRERQQPTA